MEKQGDELEDYSTKSTFDDSIEYVDSDLEQGDESEEDYWTIFDDSREDVDSDPEMTAEERAIYEAQVDETDGFDVKSIPGVNEIGQINPMDLSSEGQMEVGMICTKMAIAEYNKRLKGTEGKLELHKLLMAMCTAARGLRYYLTFDAKNLGKGGKIFTYQAVVLMGPGREDKVQSFRLKPSGSKKEWFWVSHLCGGCSSESKSDGESDA